MVNWITIAILHFTSPTPVPTAATSQDNSTSTSFATLLRKAPSTGGGIYLPILVMLALTMELVLVNGRVEKASYVSTCLPVPQSDHETDILVSSVVLGKGLKRGEAELPSLFQSPEPEAEQSQLICRSVRINDCCFKPLNLG